MPPGSSVCSGQGPGWAGLRAQDRGQERALGEARIGARSQQGARQRFPRAADSPAEGGQGPEWDCSSEAGGPGGRGQAAPAGGEEEEPSLLTSLHFLGLCSPQALPAPDRRAGGRGPACQDHPAPSLLRLRPPLPQAGSGHEILLKTFPLQNNPSKYVFENRLLIRTGRS